MSSGSPAVPAPPSAMRALRYAGRGAVEVVEWPVPRPGPGEVLVQVAFCGVCGSDFSEFETGPHQAWVEPRPHPVTGHRGPVVLGHELSGWVVDRGADVTLPPGALVSCAGGVACGACPPCREGRGNLCEDYHIVGMHRDGGLAGFCLAPASACMSAGPSGVTPAVAALAQPAGIAVHALRRAEVAAGDRVAVVGIGGVGVFLAHAALTWGAQVLAVDPDDARRGLARRLGAEVDGGSGAAAGDRFAAVFEVSGTASGLAAARTLAGPGGHLVLVGIQAAEVSLSAREIVMSELTVHGAVSLTTPVDLPEALRVLATRREGWTDVAPMAFPLQAAADHGLRVGSGGGHIKTLFSPALSAPTPIAEAERLVQEGFRRASRSSISPTE